MTKIAFFSFADIDNYGDILFSHIFKMEIEKRIPNATVDFYTPTNYENDGIFYKSYERSLIESGNYDALILFGGEVVHLYDEKTWNPIYKKNRQCLISKLPSDTVFDWTNLKVSFKAWISVGVRPIENKEHRNKILKSVDELNYVSVRGNLSKKILEDLNLQYNNPKIEITPDLGWLFPSLLEYKDLSGSLFKQYTNSTNYVVFQINNISEEESKKIASYLLEFKKRNDIDVVLLPVIRPWEDYKYLKLIDDFSNNEFFLLPNSLSILEIADILVNSQMVISSSLHAAITALAVGIPAGIFNKWHGTKLQDIFGHQFRLHSVKHDINDIPKLLDDLLEEREMGNALKHYSNFMQVSLNDLFNKLVKNIVI